MLQACRFSDNGYKSHCSRQTKLRLETDLNDYPVTGKDTVRTKFNVDANRSKLFDMLQSGRLVKCVFSLIRRTGGRELTFIFFHLECFS